MWRRELTNTGWTISLRTWVRLSDSISAWLSAYSTKASIRIGQTVDSQNQSQPNAGRREVIVSLWNTWPTKSFIRYSLHIHFGIGKFTNWYWLHVFAVLRLARCEPRWIPAVSHDVCQLSQAPGLQHHRHHAREAAGGKLRGLLLQWSFLLWQKVTFLVRKENSFFTTVQSLNSIWHFCNSLTVSQYPDSTVVQVWVPSWVERGLSDWLTSHWPVKTFDCLTSQNLIDHDQSKICSDFRQ